MPGVPDAGDGNRRIVAGPLRAELTAGVLRIGWDEPDWFGPAQFVAPDAGFLGDVGALADEPVVVLRVEAREPREGIATGDFATPAVAWHFEPRARAAGGAPEDVR